MTSTGSSITIEEVCTSAGSPSLGLGTTLSNSSPTMKFDENELITGDSEINDQLIYQILLQVM